MRTLGVGEGRGGGGESEFRLRLVFFFSSFQGFQKSGPIMNPGLGRTLRALQSNPSPILPTNPPSPTMLRFSAPYFQEGQRRLCKHLWRQLLTSSRGSLGHFGYRGCSVVRPTGGSISRHQVVSGCPDRSAIYTRAICTSGAGISGFLGPPGRNQGRNLALKTIPGTCPQGQGDSSPLFLKKRVTCLASRRLSAPLPSPPSRVQSWGSHHPLACPWTLNSPWEGITSPVGHQSCASLQTSKQQDRAQSLLRAPPCVFQSPPWRASFQNVSSSTCIPRIPRPPLPCC